MILTARTKPAAGFLGKAMMARKFAKTYRAIVTPGAPEPAQGRDRAPLRRDERGARPICASAPPDHPDAETARTRYRTLAEAPGAALLELDPETGRMHQLRVHLASIGRPIAGDARYGGALVVGGHAGAAPDAARRGAELPAPGRRREAAGGADPGGHGGPDRGAGPGLSRNGGARFARSLAERSGCSQADETPYPSRARRRPVARRLRHRAHRLPAGRRPEAVGYSE